MRQILVTSIAFLLVGCATQANYYTQTVQSWRGGNINKLVNRWGRPDDRALTADGHIAYQYQTASYHHQASPHAPLAGMTIQGGQNRPAILNQNTNFAASRGGITYNCQTTFISNRQGTILQVVEQGYGCYGNSHFASTHSNPDHQ